MYKYSIGDIVVGQVTGIQSYGIFLALDEETQGLIHISEIKHGYVSDIFSVCQLGEQLRVQIIDVDEYTGKISLSLRALLEADCPDKPYCERHPRHITHKADIGFDTVDKAMPKMIDQALKDIGRGKVVDYRKDI